MTNLLRETTLALAENDKTPRDVKWVGLLGGYMTWEEFASVADWEYDSGFGLAEVDKTLTIVGEDWWLVRVTDDGCEWWTFLAYPNQPDKKADPAEVWNVPCGRSLSLSYGHHRLAAVKKED